MKATRFKTVINSKDKFIKYVEKRAKIEHAIIQNINFKDFKVNWSEFNIYNCIIVDCELSKEDLSYLFQQGVFVYPKFKKLPYQPIRKELYNWRELMEIEKNKAPKTKDEVIYHHFNQTRFNPPMDEALTQRLHDYSIDSCLRELLKFNDEGMTEKKVVGFMGGHSALRNSESYIKTATAAYLIAQEGYYVVTGGGPGIMEAANFGAYMSAYPQKDFMNALALLQETGTNHIHPEYLSENYLEQAQKILQIYPNGNENLAIPTWFYGHEPSNIFASHIAKYFSNSLREDILLSVCLYGVVYSPGSAGTTQEIFQEATQNHYGTYGYYSPMIFFSKKRYAEDTALYSTLHQLAKGMRYKDLLFLTDEPEEVVRLIKNHPPVKKI